MAPGGVRRVGIRKYLEVAYMCMGTCIHMYIGLCIDMKRDGSGMRKYRHVCGNVCGHVSGHVYRHAYRLVNGRRMVRR